MKRLWLAIGNNKWTLLTIVVTMNELFKILGNYERIVWLSRTMEGLCLASRN
jgi:hypothetical protein